MKLEQIHLTEVISHTMCSGPPDEISTANDGLYAASELILSCSRQ